MLFAAGDLADAVGEKPDEALAEGRQALEHFLKKSRGKEKQMDGFFGAAGDGEMGHARKREQAGDVTFLDDENRAVGAFGLAARENAALEENRHVLRLGAFLVDDFTRGEAGFHAIGDEPLELVLREIGEDGNLPELFDEAREIVGATWR